MAFTHTLGHWRYKMADTKISQLTGATTPLDGTEVLPIVQSGTTKKVAVSDLTAGRAVSAFSLTSTGNLNFTGTGNRITGDFSNGTPSNLTLFQTSTANSTTVLGAVSNGTSTACVLRLYSLSDPNNSPVTQIVSGGGASTTSFQATRTGTGSFQPMTFFVNGSERVRYFLSGGVSIGDTTDPGAGNLRVGVGSLVIGTSGQGVVLPGGITWTSGAGSPEGVVTAPVGSLYSRSDGGVLTSLYVKQSGSGNTGWAGK
jgi:hypothetical protein